MARISVSNKEGAEDRMDKSASGSKSSRKSRKNAVLSKDNSGVRKAKGRKGKRGPASKDTANTKGRRPSHASKDEGALDPPSMIFDTTLDDRNGVTSQQGYTFGLELELILSCSLEEMLPRIPNRLKGGSRKELQQRLQTPTEEGGLDHIVRMAVQEILVSAGVEVNDARAKDESIQKWTVDVEPAIDPSRERRADPDSVIIGVEIKTGALEYSAASLAEVASGISALKSKYQITCNESCGLHVHVGRIDRTTGRQEQFDVETCKNLIILELLFESELGQMHPPHVLQGDDWPRWPGVRFATEHGLDRLAAATYIYKIRDVDSLLRLLLVGKQDDRNLTTNLQNLGAKTTYGTIEFRQHEGTVDLEVALRRIQLCIDFVHWSAHAQGDIERLIWAVTQGFKLETVGLLKYLGVTPETVRFYEQKICDLAGTNGVGSNASSGSDKLIAGTLASPSTAFVDEPSNFKQPSQHQYKHIVQGSRLILSTNRRQHAMQYKIVGDGPKPFWKTEEAAVALRGLSKWDLCGMQHTRRRRWPGTRREVIRRRWRS